MVNNINIENDFSDLSSTLEFILNSHTKRLYTCLPAKIISYDKATKRASVLPLIKTRLESGETQNKPQINNVPVILPSGGGFVLSFPIKPNDPVLLIFSQRGISEFKKAFQISEPDKGCLLSLPDAIAIAGFGSLSISPVGEGASLQNETGGDYISVENGSIKITTTGDVAVDCVNANINASSMTTINSNLTVNGDALISGSLAWAGMASGINGQSARFSVPIEGTEFTAGSISLTSHTHTDSLGGDTSEAESG